jgi:hypothetical protein
MIFLLIHNLMANKQFDPFSYKYYFSDDQDCIDAISIDYDQPIKDIIAKNNVPYFSSHEYERIWNKKFNYLFSFSTCPPPNFRQFTNIQAGLIWFDKYAPLEKFGNISKRERIIFILDLWYLLEIFAKPRNIEIISQHLGTYLHVTRDLYTIIVEYLYIEFVLPEKW